MHNVVFSAIKVFSKIVRVIRFLPSSEINSSFIEVIAMDYLTRITRILYGRQLKRLLLVEEE